MGRRNVFDFKSVLAWLVVMTFGVVLGNCFIQSDQALCW